MVAHVAYVQVLTLRVGISFIDLEHAQHNLNVQMGVTASFDQVRASMTATWNALLSRLSVDPATPKNDTVRRLHLSLRCYQAAGVVLHG